MHWWDYFSLVGVLLVIALPVLPCQYTPLVVAIALHLLLDFTLQSGWACSKATNHNALLLHSTVAGFLPMAGMGLAAGNPGFAFIAGMFGFGVHLAIDGQDKFGLPLWPGLVVDQALHLAVIIILFSTL